MDDATLPDDELALPHFEQRLLAELVSRQRAGAWSASPNGVRADGTPPQLTDLGALGSPAPLPPRRRRRLALAGVIGVAAAVAVAAFVVSSGGDDESTDLGTQEESEAPVVAGIEEDILNATEMALATTVVHAKDGNGMESWSDEQSKAIRFINPESAVPQLLDHGRSVPPSLDQTGSFDAPVATRTVDYCRREWADTEDPPLWIGTGSGVENIVGGLERGTLHVDGTEAVDGRELLRVIGIRAVEELPDDMRQRLADAGVDLTIGEDGSVGYDDRAGMTHDEAAEHAELVSEALTLIDSSTYYVDPATNLPVMMRALDGTTTNVEFLPRSAESLALLVPPIPEGFTQVLTTALDDERYRLGCV